jgi:DNA-directed RNA polymerase subunit E'/Rpb7
MASKSTQKTRESKRLKVEIIDAEKNEVRELQTDKSIDKSNDKSIDKNNVVQVKSSNVFNPYINTTLVCPVMLYPNQLDNKKYLHLKTNLSNKLVGKCYKNYGFICDIYKIEETSDGIIEAEDPTCSSKYIVKFSCKLCYPIKDREIIFKIDRMNKALIGGVNGPLRAIITPDKINKEKFYPDNNRNIRIKGNTNIVLPDMFIKVRVMSSSFSDADTNILVIGFLVDIANPEEIEMFNKQDK